MSPYRWSTNNMENCDCKIIATEKQLQLLQGPKSTESLLAADFLGNQDYINEWIMDWTQGNDYLELPLCVQESIITDKNLRKHYHRYVKAAVVSHDVDWIKSHYIVAYERVWNYVQFEHIPIQMFQVLWALGPVPLDLVSFVAASRRLDLWRTFVSHYDPTECLGSALKQQWSNGVLRCINEGADLTAQDFVRDAMLMEPLIVRSIINANPPATAAAFSDFLLWKRLHRIQNVPLVEEFFWINGFKEESCM